MTELDNIKKIIALRNLVSSVDIEQCIDSPILVYTVVKEAKEIIND